VIRELLPSPERARINLFCRLLFFCSVATIAFVGVTHGGGPGTNVNNAFVSAPAETYRFIAEAYSKQDLLPYVDMVWDQVTSQLKRDRIEPAAVSKEDVALIIADLNDDGRKDIIAVVAGNMLFCGKFGRECSLMIFISTDTGFRRVECCMNVGWEEFPISILKTKSHGLRDMVLNSRFVVRFNGRSYCDR
jgi:hypothetical protein